MDLIYQDDTVAVYSNRPATIDCTKEANTLHIPKNGEQPFFKTTFGFDVSIRIYLDRITAERLVSKGNQPAVGKYNFVGHMRESNNLRNSTIPNVNEEDQYLKELLSEKLSTQFVIDITEMEAKDALYTYFRGTANNSLVSFTLGNGWIGKDGLYFSAYDFKHEPDAYDLAELPAATMAGRAICQHLGINSQEKLQTYFWSKDIIINYYW